MKSYRCHCRMLALLLALGVSAAWANAGSSASASTGVPSTARSAASGGALRPVLGYPGKWQFNANDGTPIATVHVSSSGSFAFTYRPSYCGSGSFVITGRFLDSPFRNAPYEAVFAGLKGDLVTLAIHGSCKGRANSDGNTFTWSKARGIALGGTWPLSRAVQGVMIQTAVTQGARGDLEIDWSMDAA